MRSEPAPSATTHVIRATAGRPVDIDVLSALHIADPVVSTTRLLVTISLAEGVRVRGRRVVAASPQPAVVRGAVVLRRPRSDSTLALFAIVFFSPGLTAPHLPDTTLAYADSRAPTPRHFLTDVSGSAVGIDNTPATNRVTDAGATLGRVLFYDTRFSSDDRISCASCHHQEFGFADTARYSRGVGGAMTRRHTMALLNARYYQSGKFFRDERAATLETQVLEPVRNLAEMGLSIEDLVLKIRATPWYAPLFAAAYGSPDVTRDRIARALAQFVRSMKSTHARVDSIFRGGGPPDLSVLSSEERLGRQLFLGRATCARCHRTSALTLDVPDNIGLDSVDADSGAGKGRFKVASLRNVAVRSPYMHDGRFATLREVVEFYDHGIHDNANLDPRLRGIDGAPMRLGLTTAERDAVVAYLGTFTDRAFLGDPRFSSPFTGP